eukprot:12932946-Prorocentrum_lima.AAC.1
MLDRNAENPEYKHQHVYIACPGLRRSYALVDPKVDERNPGYEIVEKAAWHYWEQRSERLDFKPIDYCSRRA